MALYNQNPEMPRPRLGGMGRRRQLFPRAPAAPGIATGPVGRPPAALRMPPPGDSITDRRIGPTPFDAPQIGKAPDFGAISRGFGGPQGPPPMDSGGFDRIRAGLQAQFGTRPRPDQPPMERKEGISFDRPQQDVDAPPPPPVQNVSTAVGNVFADPTQSGGANPADEFDMDKARFRY